MSTQKKDQYRETVPHKSHFVPVSVHTTKIEIPTETDGAAALPEKNFPALYLHWHPELEFFYVEEGEAEFFIENHAFLLKEGDGIFVPPKLMHWARTKGTVLFHAAVADPLWLISPHNSECFQKYMYPVCGGSWKYAVTFTSEKNWQNEILEQLKFIFSMDEEKIAAKELLIQGTFLMIWQKLYDHHLKSFYPDAKKRRPQLEYLQKSVSYIETHYMEDLTLEELASQVHLSRGQFCRLFQAWTGMTPFCYLNRCRVLNSSQMLARSSKKISEIASLCGFNSISYFNRTFLKITGMTPSSYRNEMALIQNHEI